MLVRTSLVVAALLLAVPTVLAIEQEHELFLHEYSGGLHLVPEQINAHVGDVLKMTVQNLGASPHNFMVCGDGVKPQEACDDKWGFTGMIQANDTAMAQATVTKSGTFEYFCYIAGHKGAGMKGLLIVASEGSSGKGVPGLPVGGALLAAGVALLAWRRRA